MNNKTACLLLSLCQAGPAAALGLGDLSVRSSLGQPLHATVTLLEPGPDLATECFSLGPASGSVAPPLRAKLSLEHGGTSTLLHIRTPQSLHEPVVQFALRADCETRLQRDYVVLLDPPAADVPAVDAAGAAQAAAVGPASPPPRKRAVRAPVPTAAASAAPHKPRARPSPPPASRLVLSGRRLGEPGSAFALKLDTNLPDLNRTLPAGLTATELSDENTALTHKLAHLESQLAALRQRNAELDAERTRHAPPRAAPPTPEKTKARPQWPFYLLAGGLLASAAILVVWLRRRSRAFQSTSVLDDSWITPELPPARRPDTAEPAERPPTPAHEADEPAATERMPDIPPPTPAESTEVKDDILDQAEVYMAHGHANLAVHLLQEHLRAAPTESPVPWLLLLDLLHREGDTEGYAAASAECRRHFNVNLSDHPVSQDNDNAEGLEAYPHVLDQLVQVWNSPGRDAFFRDLIYDHRGGTRMGFRPAAYRDIILLRAIAQDTPVASAA